MPRPALLLALAALVVAGSGAWAPTPVAGAGRAGPELGELRRHAEPGGWPSDAHRPDYARNRAVLARIAAQASFDAYGSPPDRYGFPVADREGHCANASFVRRFRNNEVAVYEDAGAGWQVVAFRGTDADLEDWWDNVWMNSEECDLRGSCGRVHSGYFAEVRVRIDQIRAALDLQAHMMIVGHSLGGAMAMLAGLYLRRRGVPEVHVVTFGQPKIALAGFAEAFAAANISTYDRYVATCGGGAMSDEYATRWFPGYEHLGREIVLDAGSCDAVYLHGIDLYLRLVAAGDGARTSCVDPPRKSGDGAGCGCRGSDSCLAVQD
ncbi:Alpha/Beta hydrolase protein [Hyaloraphidium curvatum]|nr:Alpha/Beta hydrolase protein [Hyaloraphidium curvatum]